jgi:hypothetical protein
MKREGLKHQMIIGFLIMLLLTISLMLPQFNTVSAKPQRDPVGSLAPPPEISIVPDRDQYSLSTEPGASDNIVIIIGSVFCEIPDSVPPNTECYVQIFIEFMMTETETLPLMTFTNEITKLEFTHEIDIEEGSPAGSTYHAIIHGNWQYDGGLGYGDVNSAYVYIEITQYGSAEIENTYLTGAWEMEVGKAEEFSIVIYNFGNGDDTLTIEILEQPEGITIEMELDKIMLKRNGKREIWVKVKQSDGGGKTGIIRFGCSSPHDGILSTESLDISYRTKKTAQGSSAEIGLIIFGIVFILSISLIVFLVIKNKKKGDGYH